MEQNIHDNNCSALRESMTAAETSLKVAAKLLAEVEKSLGEKNITIEQQREKIEKLSKRFQEKVQELTQLQNAPESFKGKPGYEKLTELMAKAEKYDAICRNPDSVDEHTEMGKCVRKARMLTLILDNPEKLLSAKGSDQHPLTNVVRKGLLLDKVKTSPELVATEAEFADTELFRRVKSLQQFGEYKNYWKNLQSPLLSALCQLFRNDEVYNTRVLMFYASQLYSISCIMNEIHGDNTQSVQRHKVNVSVFNNDTGPAISCLGLPDPNVQELEGCKFEYTGSDEEKKMVPYLKRYAPLPFIFINSYYSDDILS